MKYMESLGGGYDTYTHTLVEKLAGKWL